MKNGCWKRLSLLALCVAVAGCMGTNNGGSGYDTPTVDYVEGLNVNDAPHQESFLNQLAMNYRSYALYNARTSGYPDIAELFAQKAVGAFSGETPFPESLDNWKIRDESERFEIYTAYNNLIDELKNDAAAAQPQLTAEAQAKFDCWISAAASGQNATARECERRFKTAMETLQDCDHGRVVAPTYVASENMTPEPVVAEAEEQYYPETRRLSAMSGTSRSREGIVIVNNVNVPATPLVQTVPVPQQKQQTPIVFNQNIYGGEENINGGSDTFNNSENYSSSCDKCLALSADEISEDESCTQCQEEVDNNEHDGYVTREEFISLMLSLRSELAAINARLDEKENQKAAAVVVNNAVPAQEQKMAPVVMNTVTPAPSPIVMNMVTPAAAPEQKPSPIVMNSFTDAPAPEQKPSPIVMNSFTDAPAPEQKSAPVVMNTVVPVAKNSDKTIIKVQQIPLEPRQRIMEEIFEIRFDFDKATIKPEYDSIIKQLAQTTQANKNVKVSVVGHTDTAGSSAYNYALGGRRAEAVQKMLIEYGIPASQIIAVSAGEEDLKVQTPNNTPNAENRRVRVVKEVQYTEQPEPSPIIVEEYTETDDCDECGYEDQE